MNGDDERALASLRREQTILQGRVKSLEEQWRLHEKLGHSRYYLDMQLRALRSELTLCQYRIRQLERGLASPGKPRRAAARGEPTPRPEEGGRHLLPVLAAFIVSLLALGSAGLLWYERFGEQPPALAAPTATVVAARPTETPTPVVPPTPTALAEVYAVNGTAGLNVRQSAGTTAPVLRVLTRGAIVLLTGDQEDADGRLWYRLKDDGWIAAEHVQVFPTREEAEEAARGLSR